MNARISSIISIGLLFLCFVVWFVLGAGNAVAQDRRNHEPNMTWTERVITERELDQLSKKDMDLSYSVGLRLLAKLNARDFDYIAQDIRAGKPIRVPNDFVAFKSWTPLYRYIPDLVDLPKFILIVKDWPYIGWYERGQLVGDTYICIGKVYSSTREGLYTVKQKDVDHVSRSYPNAYGVPAPMPWALRIYETVWIHAGDIVAGRCSHGCVNLPMFPAMKLFDWAPTGTPVLIVDSLGSVPTVLAQNRSNCTLHASYCSLELKS
ncbi:MAG: L,D-transpeptidase, partial [Syntrophobacteraceae bacterium]